MELNIDVYIENKKYCIYVGEDNSSGYLCTGDTQEECISELSNYIKDCFDRINIGGAEEEEDQ